MKGIGNREQGTGSRSLLAMAFLALAAATSFGATPTMYPYELPAKHLDRDQALHCQKADEIIAAGGKLELGQWYTGWAAVKKYSEENKVPVFFIWSNHGCVHCWYTDSTLTQSEFLTWKASNDAGKVIYCFMAGGEKDCPADAKHGDAYNWMYETPNKLGAFPFVTLYWPGHGNDGFMLHTTGDDFCGSKNMSEKSYPERIKNVIAKMEAAFAGWHPTPEYTYEGGWFTQTNYPWATPAAEKTTKYVDVEIRRSSTVVCTQDLQIVGRESGSVKIIWAAGQLAQTNRIESFDAKYFNSGKDVTLQLMGKDKDGKDAVASVTKVKCFTDAEAKPSAANPKWIGESFGFGEWTMDLTNAQNKVFAATGDAYTLVLMAGSLWCPDCYRTDVNFLGVTDEGGNNKFEKWAKEHNVALVQIDLPRLTGGTVMTPTLLSREAGTGGFTAEGGSAKAEASGVGYLTRKGVSDAEAAKILARNVSLAQKNTYEGGFHRPEDANPYRTGVPVFVLLRKDGTVAARLTRFASVSPSAPDKFDNYLKRFDEMLDIAKNNMTEIENNGVTSNRLVLAANGGVATNRISHTDDRDLFGLVGVTGNAKLRATVKGVASDAEVVVSFVTPGADGKEEELTSVSGKLDQKDGLVLENVFSRGGGAFVKVAAKDIASDAFKVDSPITGNFQTFEIRTELIGLVPGEDKATAKPSAGSDKVKIELVEGAVYRLGGAASNCCEKLTAVVGHPGFYRASGSGIFELTLDKVDGELTYQKWNAGTVGFGVDTLEVDRSVCDTSRKPVEIPVVRTGKSGWVKVRVSLDTESAPYADGRVWLMNGEDKAVADLEWEDGDAGEKTVKVWIEDKLGEWDELTEIPLTITAIESECDADGEGFAAAIDGTRGVFKLLVTAEATGATGTVTISEIVPEFARKTTVYVRESEGVTLTAVRKGGNAQLVAALLKSSYKDTKFVTEDTNDLTAIEKEYPAITNLADYAKLKDANFLWWANRESGEKKVTIKGIPAGKSAKIQLLALKPLENAGDYGSFTIISVKDSVPGFAETGRAIDLTRYVESNEAPFALTNIVTDGKISFSKMSGKLPPGLKVGLGPDGASMVLTGTTKAKPGSYPVTYQVKQGGVAGTTISLDIQVSDISELGPGGELPNLVVAGKTRTLKSVPVFDLGCKCMVGTLQLTVPATGKLSAKLVTADGKDSFASKSWLQRDLDGTMETDLSSRKGDSILHVEADRQGGVSAQFTEGPWTNLVAFTDGAVAWSKDEPADDWKGYYTVALENKGVVEGAPPSGHGYLTLKMDAASACRKGQFKVAGKLANGKSVSASVVLQMIQQKACLPVFSSSSKDVFAALAEVDRGAFMNVNQRECVRSPEFAVELVDSITDYKVFNALQTVRKSAKSAPYYRLAYGLRGSWWNPKESLCDCQDVREVSFVVGTNFLAKVEVKFEDGKNKLESRNTDLLDITLKNDTGIIVGTIKGEPSRSFFGIVVNGEEDCGCNPEVEPNPLACGSAAEMAVTLKVEKNVAQ